jgi:N utilization substance protein B
MGERRGAREWVVQLLFQLDINPGSIDEALDDFWAGKRPSARAKAFTEDLLRGVLDHRDELDQLLRIYADNWDLKRMAVVDRNILRLALYEMWHRDDIPPVVTIDEAVDLAKAFSGLKAGKFVNGILDRAIQDVDRPPRSARDPSIPHTGQVG